MASDQAAPLRVDVHWDGVVATVTVAGELDLTTARPASPGGSCESRPAAPNGWYWSWVPSRSSTSPVPGPSTQCAKPSVATAR